MIIACNAAPARCSMAAIAASRSPSAVNTLSDPVITDTGSRIPGLPLGRPRSHALLSALLTFRTQVAGFTNHDLRTLTAELRGLAPASVTACQTTYDLRRL